MNIVEQLEVLRTNMPTFLHGSEAQSLDAALTMNGTVETDETAAALITFFLDDAASSVRALDPSTGRLVDAGSHFYVLHPGQDVEPIERAVVQMINTTANGDVVTLTALLRTQLDHASDEQLGLLFMHLRGYTRTLHLRVCSGVQGAAE